jgi:arsenite methyltransferase
MKTLEVFDRPLCCSSGVCGPGVDPALVHFAADLAWLQEQGIEVRRYNLAFEPAAFTKYDDVKEALRVGQVDCLPLVRFDGRIVSKRGYPSRELLAGWTGIEMATPPVEGAKPCCDTSCCK